MGIDSMKITVIIMPENSIIEVDLKSGSKVYDVLKKINLKPDACIVLKGNAPIPVDEILDEEQELSILQVASGG